MLSHYQDANISPDYILHAAIFGLIKTSFPNFMLKEKDMLALSFSICSCLHNCISFRTLWMHKQLAFSLPIAVAFVQGIVMTLFMRSFFEDG